MGRDLVRADSAANSGPSITVDTTQLATLRDFAVKAQAVATDWYPRIVHILGTTAKPDEKITIVIDFAYHGVAATFRNNIVICPDYFAEHPDDLGAIVHEMTHVVQAYHGSQPSWLVEGMADYVRFFQYEPAAKRPHPNPVKAHARDSYRTTAAFLDWTVRTYDKDLIPHLDAVMKQGHYTDACFQTLTGKTLDALDAEWRSTLHAVPPTK